MNEFFENMTPVAISKKLKINICNSSGLHLPGPRSPHPPKKGGGSKFLVNVGNFLPSGTASYPTRVTSSPSRLDHLPPDM
jgi:hypothetical protein